MGNMENKIIIIGSGAAGLNAALELAKNKIKSILVSDMPSERSQSVMAEGGINAAVNTEIDSCRLHAEETIKAGRNISDYNAVSALTKAAPKIIDELFSAGMSFTLNSEGKPDVRAFGGQSVKRTFYAASDTGKQLMHTLIDQTRRYEADGFVERMTGWIFYKLLYSDNTAYGCILINSATHEKRAIYGKIIIASGGLGGMFGNTTGSVRNTGAVSANLFASGVCFADCEFIQYHPTTIRLNNKNMLISEAVRGEGGRLYVLENDKPYYFMEEKYPEFGNLMPRDVIVREEYSLMQKGYQIYLDMRQLDKNIYDKKLKGVIDSCIRFADINPTEEPIPVEPGIHYFMGGISVDCNHRTSIKNLYAAGECACQYHGANRLGGNSLLGAIYGGRIAAHSAMEYDSFNGKTTKFNMCDEKSKNNSPGSFVDGIIRLNTIMKNGLNVVRNEEMLNNSILQLDELLEKTETEYDETATEFENQQLADCCLFGKAMLMCAKARKESRGAHIRSDYPNENTEFEKQTITEFKNGEIQIYFQKAGERYEY